MIKYKKYICELCLSIIAILVLISFVNAIGMSGDYHSGNPLKVGPGESIEAAFGRFQNPDNISITLKIEISEGGDIATLIGDNLNSFVIPAGNLNTPLNVKVSIPEGVSEGTNYTVTIKYTDITDKGGSGMITMAEAKTSSIPILVEKTPIEPPVTPEKPLGSIAWVVIVLVLAVIIAIVAYLLLRKKNIK